MSNSTLPSIQDGIREVRSDQYVARQERRFEVGDSDLRVGLRRQTLESEEILVGRAVDISSRGLKLEVNQSLSFGEKVSLTFWSEVAGLETTVAAEIRWFRKLSKEDKWVAGCLIENPLSGDTIQSLAQTHAIDRRKSERFGTEFHALGRLAAAQTPFQIVVLDHSAEGMRLISSVPVHPKDPIKVLMQIDDEGRDYVEIQATVRWSQKYDCGYLVGCEVASTSLADFRNCSEWIASTKGLRSTWLRGSKVMLKSAVFFLTLILAYIAVASL